MQAGLMTKIIEIYKPQISKNEFAEQVTNYNFYKKIRAQVKFIQGNNIIENYERVIYNTIIFSVRIYQKIDDLDRIKFNNKLYRINSIEKNDIVQCLNINCQEINQ